MFGAFIGDIVGSTREFQRCKDWDFELFPSGSSFTDDSIMTAAIGDALMDWKDFGGDLRTIFTDTMRNYGKRYPYPVGGYGGGFVSWLSSKHPQPYNSYPRQNGQKLCG